MSTGAGGPSPGRPARWSIGRAGHQSPPRRRTEPGVPNIAIVALAASALAASALAAPLAAQVCQPGPSSNEAKTLAIFSVPLAFSPATAPELLPGLQAGLEVASLPNVDPAT